MAEFDFQERYLRTVFAFIGITDVEFVRIEGVALSPKHREDAITAGFSAGAAAGHKVAVALSQQNQRAA